MERTEGTIDLSGWSLGFGVLDQTLAPEIASALEATLSTCPPELHLLSDGSIELVLEGLSHLGQAEPVWQQSLASVVEAEIDLATLLSGNVDLRQRGHLEGIASALEAAASRIRQALEEGS